MPTIRRVADRDIRALGELYIRCRHAAVPEVPTMVHSDSQTRDWIATVVCGHSSVWVVEGHGLVAMLVLDGGELDQLYVDPLSQGEGIGSRLIDLAKRESPAGLELWTFESNVGAQRFYEHHGFVEVGRTDGDNEEGAPDIRYRWVPVGLGSA